MEDFWYINKTDLIEFPQEFCAKIQNECGVIPEGISTFPWLALVVSHVHLFGTDQAGAVEQQQNRRDRRPQSSQMSKNQNKSLLFGFLLGD